MLRSCLQFFKCNENQEVNENSLLFPKKLLMEVDREIKYRQKYLILCTLITGTLAVAGTSAGLGLLFQFEKNNVTELANANPNNKLDNADYHVHQITLYLGLPTVSLAILGLEFSCMYHALKKYFKYPENAPVTDLSPALLEKVKDFFKNHSI